MIKKIIYSVNILLAVIFASKLYVLHAEIGADGEEPSKVVNYSPIEVQRPSPKADSRIQNVFGTQSVEEATPVAADNPHQEGLNQIVTKGELIRIQGIFITRERRYAVISITNKKDRNKVEVIKAEVGDYVRQFMVDSIAKGSVNLASGSSHTIQLKIFKSESSQLSGR